MRSNSCRAACLLGTSRSSKPLISKAVSPVASGLSFAARPRRLRRETQPALGGEPNERAADIGAVGPPLFESVAEAQRQRFDLLKSDPARVAPARCGDAPRQNPLRDRDRRGEQRASVDGAFRTEPRLDFSRQMRQRLLGVARAARQPIERLGVEAFLAEAGKERTQPGAREARVGVGRVVDERRAARIGEGDRDRASSGR